MNEKPTIKDVREKLEEAIQYHVEFNKGQHSQHLILVEALEMLRGIETSESIALSNVLYERKCQDEKWGEQNHVPLKWLAILLEEIGEASKDLLENELIKYRDEMVQVAAVALAAVESFDRQALEGENG